MSDKPKKLTVIAVCGCGMGSSVLLRMAAEKIFRELNIPASVEVADATTGKGAARGKDVIMVSVELKRLFEDAAQPVIVLNNFTDKEELRTKITEHLKSIGRL